MFKILRNLKKNTSEEVTVEKVVKDSVKTTNQIIEEIHESFYTEVDKLLAEAKISIPKETDKQPLIDKCTRLKALGFTSTKEIIEAEEELNRLISIDIENKNKSNLVEAINYFSFKYPHYKFITEESVKKICEKYNLVYGDISKYTGTVPDVNLKHIEDFKIADVDCCYLETISYSTLYYSNSNGIIISYDDFKKGLPTEDYNGGMHFSREYKKCSLEIAGPLSDFNMSESEIKDFKVSKIEIPDPVVLQPVYFKGKKHYLVVTAWGLEASDELVLNPINN